MQKRNLLTFLKYRVKRIIPHTVWSVLSRKFQSKRNIEFSEQTFFNRIGKPETEVYLIRRRPPGGGLFSNVNHVLQGIEYAKQNNLTPVVDMQNYWTSYSQMKPFNNSKNAWDYFFEPVSTIRLEETAKFQSLIFSKGDRILPNSPLADRGLSFVLDRELLLQYSSLYKENIKLNKPTQEFIGRVKEFLEWEKSTLGVSYRGTYYVENEPRGHARQPSLSLLLSKVDTKLASDRYSKLFLSTEDGDARKLIRDTYPDLVYEDFRNKKTIQKLLSDRHNHSKQTIEALGYLAEIYLLSECLSVTCSIANGSVSALLINGGTYQEPDVIDLGTYT
jgi:hypothetical protein